MYIRSSPSRRFYLRNYQLINLAENKNHLLLTSKGFIWLEEAKKLNIGGELILSVD